MWISIIILICGQFDLLFCSVKNILWSAMLLRGDELSIKRLREVQEEFSSGSVKSESSSISYYISVEMSEDIRFENWRSKVSEFGDSDSSWNYDQEMLIVLRRAVLLHHNILRMSAMLEEFFSPFMLGKTSVCCLLSCFLAYLSSSGLGSIMKVVTLLEYLMLVFAELLLNTYFPTSLMYQVGIGAYLWISVIWHFIHLHFIRVQSFRKLWWILRGWGAVHLWEKCCWSWWATRWSPLYSQLGKFSGWTWIYVRVWVEWTQDYVEWSTIRVKIMVSTSFQTLKASFSYYTLLKKLQ